MYRTPFPKHIDKPRVVGPFEIDEAAFIIVGVGLMLLVGFATGLNVSVALISGVIGGLFGAVTIKGIKKNFADGYLYHLAYTKGLRHPVFDDPNVRLFYSYLFKKDIKIMPQGFITTLVE